MKYRLLSIFGLFLLVPSLSMAFFVRQKPVAAFFTRQVQAFPQVDRNYVYDQLFTMVTQFVHREAGYDRGQPSNINGHNEFADYWGQEMLRDLQGFGPQLVHDPFNLKGWAGRPATVPAFNVEVSVPGLTYPDQVVVVGCHYDGMADSTQSANDDGSGCAIELAVAKAMADYWRVNHVYPARTLRFVLFDAEEQGMFGSAHYVNATINGNLPNVIAMFNEEQNGIAYPLRYLGNADNPLLPLYVMMTPLHNNSAYTFPDGLSAQRSARIARFRDLMQQAPAQVFAELREMGLQELSYHVAGQQDAFQPIFTPDQMSNIQVEDDIFGHSDQVPFTLAGLPCVTFEGNYTYYDRNPPPWSYPYDQPDDTIQLMNIFANGSSHKAQALTLSLTVPAMLTTWMLIQPDILGQASFDDAPVVSFADLGPLQAGRGIVFDASGSFPPEPSSADVLSMQHRFHYFWDFGDGGTGSGPRVSHSYATAGTYAVTLTIDSPDGQSSVTQSLTVANTAPYYPMPYRWDGDPGINHTNAAVTLPRANNGLSDAVRGSPAVLTPTATVTTTLATEPTSQALPRTTVQVVKHNPGVSGASALVGLIVVLDVGLFIILALTVLAQSRQRLQRSSVLVGVSGGGGVQPVPALDAPPEKRVLVGVSGRSTPPGVLVEQEIAQVLESTDVVAEQTRQQIVQKPCRKKRSHVYQRLAVITNKRWVRNLPGRRNSLALRRKRAQRLHRHRH